MIKFASIFFVFACGAGVVLASGDVSQFVFTTNPQTINPNEISEIITVQAQDTSGAAVSVGKTLCLRVSSTSGIGEFSSNSENWILTNVLTINSNWKSRSFYYKDSVAGNYLIDAQIAIKPDGITCSSWPVNEWDIKWNTKQDIAISVNFSSSISQTSSSAQNSSALSSSSAQNIASGSVDYHYKNEQISAKAGEDKTAVAGADIVLEGNALGFKKEPLQNARYLWTLGDGSYKEGKNIRHVYRYPGNYIAVLNVSSGDVSASDRVNIKVIPNELQIIDVKYEFIKLKNKSGIILDISGWFLKIGNETFKFPDYSLISANSELIISSDVSGLKFAGNKFLTEILYPNGSTAFSYLPAGQASSPPVASFSSSKPKEIVSSKPPEKNINTAIVPATSVISQKNSSSSISSLNFTVEKNLPAGEAGLASVITIGEKNNSGAKILLILAVIVGIIGGAGVFLARKFTYTAK